MENEMTKNKFGNLEVLVQSFRDLSEEEKNYQPNNGMGKEYSSYMRVIHNGETVTLESSAMEPEDVSFWRDLDWIPRLLISIYKLGFNDGKKKK